MSDQPVSSLPARAGWQWFRQGVALFRRQPAALTTILFINLMGSSLVSSLPLIGPIVVVLLVPSLAMAVMQACGLIDAGRRVDLRVLGAGFRAPAFRGLLGIGFVYLLISIVLALLAWSLTDHAALEKLFKSVQSGAREGLDTSVLWPVLGISFLNLGVLVALAFSAPLVAWQRMSVGKAVFYSIVATLRAAPVFLVLLGGWLLTMFAVVQVGVMLFSLLSPYAGIVIGTWLGLVFLLLLQCALYAGYRQVFGAPQLD